MGFCCGDQVAPDETSDNRQHGAQNMRLGSSRASTNYDEPEIFVVKSRSCTNILFLILFTIFTVVLVGFLAYCMVNGDIQRILRGYDDCGNICGIRNPADEASTDYTRCIKADMSQKSFLMIEDASFKNVDPLNVIRKCVKNCSDFENYLTVGKRCILPATKDVINPYISGTGLKDFFQEVSEDFSTSRTEIIILFFTALAFSVAILVLFRFAVGLVVWLVLILASLALIGACLYLWITWYQMTKSPDDINERKETFYLVGAILASIVTIIVLLVILILRKRIKLVVQLFKESGKAIAAMPLLLIQPFITFVAIGIAITAFIYLTLWVESSGMPKNEANRSVFYRKDAIMQVTRWYNLFAFFWYSQFIIGCQHIVIASGVAMWFFSRNKSKLIGSYSAGFYNLLRYHLGTVAFGAMIIAIMNIIKFLYMLLKLMLRYTKCGRAIIFGLECCCTWICCCGHIKSIIDFATRMAYIQTAISGKNFCSAAERALGLIGSNALVVVAINSVGDFVLFLGKILVTAATVVVGVEIFKTRQDVHHSWVLIALFGLVSFFIAHCFLTVYEMAIDTIFQCFCMDCEANDGMGRPYYMSKGLMEYVKNGSASNNNSKAKDDAWSKEGSRKHAPNTIS